MSETPRRVHFVAVAGSGMGSLAGLLHARGVRVTGSDDHLYPPMSTQLAAWGVLVHHSFRAEHVLDAEPDLVVIGNAVRPDNPEARAAIDEGLPYRSFSDALYELAIAGKHSVVLSGTHGKTTTTSLVAFLLHATDRDPSMLVGGHALDFGGSFCEGDGPHFVVEGDEYDTAFFDKTPKFLHYHPRTLAITSVEFDHADIYRDLDHVKQAFRALVARMPTARSSQRWITRMCATWWAARLAVSWDTAPVRRPVPRAGARRRWKPDRRAPASTSCATGPPSHGRTHRCTAASTSRTVWPPWLRSTFSGCRRTRRRPRCRAFAA